MKRFLIYAKKDDIFLEISKLNIKRDVQYSKTGSLPVDRFFSHLFTESEMSQFLYKLRELCDQIKIKDFSCNPFNTKRDSYHLQCFVLGANFMADPKNKIVICQLPTEKGNRIFT